MEVPMPTQTFHPFPRLPLELRREIYKLTIASVPRMSDITEIRFEDYSVSGGEYAWSKLTRLYIIPKRSKSCALLFVSTESRDFAQKELEPKMLKLDPKRCAINYRTFSDLEGAVHELRIGVFHSAENAKQHGLRRLEWLPGRYKKPSKDHRPYSKKAWLSGVDSLQFSVENTIFSVIAMRHLILARKKIGSRFSSQIQGISLSYDSFLEDMSYWRRVTMSSGHALFYLFKLPKLEKIIFRVIEVNETPDKNEKEEAVLRQVRADLKALRAMSDYPDWKIPQLSVYFERRKRGWKQNRYSWALDSSASE